LKNLSADHEKSLSMKKMDVNKAENQTLPDQKIMDNLKKVRFLPLKNVLDKNGIFP